jgi:MoaA/NifB/PqqE/SkfB family radical SAM enzyme
MLIKKIYFLSIYAFKVLFRKPLFLNLNVDVTENCTQNCPMCNSSLNRKTKEKITGDHWLDIFQRMKKYHIATVSLSGGEPTLVKDIWKVFKPVKKQFPFGVLFLTNLYGEWNYLKSIIEKALEENIDISVSFDGFGAVADKLRGAKNVSAIVEKNLWLLKALKKEKQSKSKLSIHTVLSDDNLNQAQQILNLVQN